MHVLRTVSPLSQHLLWSEDLLLCTDVDGCLVTLVTFLEVFRRSSNTWLRRYCPSSLFIIVLSCFLIVIASLTHLVKWSASLSSILASFQLMTLFVNFVLFFCRCQVWSASSLAQHNPPTDFLWKEQNKWGTGPECTTILCKPNGQVGILWIFICHEY